MKTLLVSLILLGSCVSFASPLVNVVNTNQNLYSVNAANNSESLLGNTTFATDSLAVAPNGTLYSANGGILFNVSAFQPVGPLGFSSVGDLDYANGGLWGFSNANQTLFFFDLGTQMVTSSLTLSSFANLTVTGVAFNPANNAVYLSANSGYNTDKLYMVPQSSNSASLIGSMSIGDSPSYISDIDFDGLGTLYSMSWFNREFRTVNISNGATTLVNFGPHRDSTGMAIQVSNSSQPVPEPFTGLLAVGCGLAAWRRRRK